MTKLVTFGFGLAEYDNNGAVYTSNAVMSYFEELLNYFDTVEIYIPLVTTEHNFSSKFTNPRIHVYPYVQSKLGFIKTFPSLLSAVADANVLIFIPSASRLAPILSLIKYRSRSMALYVADDPFEFAGHLSLSFIPGYDKLYLKSVAKFISSCNPVLCAGKKVANICKEYTNNVYESLPQGQPLPKSDVFNKSGISKSKKQYTVLFLNRVVENKGIFDLLKAYEKLADRRDEDIRLVFTGDGVDLKRLKDLANESKYKDKIEFSGWVDDQSTLEKIWNSSDLYILPSNHTEGRPRGVEEAIARRVPCIASKVGGIPDEHGNGQVYLIKPGEPDEIANAIESVLFDVKCRQSLLDKAESRRKWLTENGSAAKQHALLILDNYGA